MADYNNQNTRLTAPRYAWSATIAHRPLNIGRNPSKDCTGTYTTQPDATVADVLNGITAWYSRTHQVPADNVAIIRYSLKPKS